MIIIKINTQDKIDSNILLKIVREHINEGLVPAWEIDADNDFVLTDSEWGMKAWMTPTIISEDELRFGIIEPKSEELTKGSYAVYHARLAEMLLAYFDSEIESLTISSQLVPEIDRYKKGKE